MQAPQGINQDIKKNFIDLVSEASEEQGARPSRPVSSRLLTKSVLALIASVWPRRRGAN
jgi:hypothetical protein